jgi:hypothetical protein
MGRWRRWRGEEREDEEEGGRKDGEWEYVQVVMSPLKRGGSQIAWSLSSPDEMVDKEMVE